MSRGPSSSAAGPSSIAAGPVVACVSLTNSGCGCWGGSMFALLRKKTRMHSLVHNKGTNHIPSSIAWFYHKYLPHIPLDGCGMLSTWYAVHRKCADLLLTQTAPPCPQQVQNDEHTQWEMRLCGVLAGIPVLFCMGGGLLWEVVCQGHICPHKHVDRFGWLYGIVNVIPCLCTHAQLHIHPYKTASTLTSTHPRIYPLFTLSAATAASLTSAAKSAPLNPSHDPLRPTASRSTSPPSGVARVSACRMDTRPDAVGRGM